VELVERVHGVQHEGDSLQEVSSLGASLNFEEMKYSPFHLRWAGHLLLTAAMVLWDVLQTPFRLLIENDRCKVESIRV
jgi:hypothetical protein